MRFRLFALDGREVGSFDDIENLKWYAGSLADRQGDYVDIDDRYDASGDCIEFVTVEGVGDVGTLDRTVPVGWCAVAGHENIKFNERRHAKKVAESILASHLTDPDGDMAILARQFLRALERRQRARPAVRIIR